MKKHCYFCCEESHSAADSAEKSEINENNIRSWMVEAVEQLCCRRMEQRTDSSINRNRCASSCECEQQNAKNFVEKNAQKFRASMQLMQSSNLCVSFVWCMTFCCSLFRFKAKILPELLQVKSYAPHFIPRRLRQWISTGFNGRSAVWQRQQLKIYFIYDSIFSFAIFISFRPVIKTFD